MGILLNILIVLGWIVVAIVAIVIIISFLRIRINAGYLEKKMYLAVYFYRLKIFSMHKGLKHEKKEKEHKKVEFEGAMESFKKWTKEFHDSKKELGELLEIAQKRVHIQTYSIIMDIGVGNAAMTGIVCGAASAFVGLITSFIGHYIRIEEQTQTIVNPKSDKVFDISGNVVVNFKIMGLLQILWKAKKMELWKKFKKN